jgi:hypothetical protein
MPKVILVALLGCLHTATHGAGQTPRIQLDRSRYMGVDQIKPGMTGMGRTVLKGTELTPFKVTVVEVLRNFGPRQHAILVRCAGAGLEHSGIIAGMSGSPVYLEDPADGNKLKMIGAIAFGWTWNKDPVGGVQPIEQMLSVGLPGTASTTQAAADDGGRWRPPGAPCATPSDGSTSRYQMAGLIPPPVPRPAASAGANGDPEGWQPLMTPLTVGSSNPAVLAYLREHCEGTGLVPVQGGGAGGTAANAPAGFEPGGSLVIPFLIGDVDMCAVGTVTEVIGNRVLGFGHSMMAEGPIELPMATGWIQSAIVLMPRSFKLGAMGRLVGTLTRDEETGVCGVSDRPARMIPVTVTIHGPDTDRTYHYQALHHRQMTPFVIGSSLLTSVLAHRDLPQEHTITYRLSVGYEKLGRLTVDNLSSMHGLAEVQSDLVEPMSLLMENPFGRARVSDVDMDVTIAAKATSATLERADLPRSRFEPGETIDVAVRWRPYRAQPFVRHYSMALPRDLPDGSYNLTLGSWMSQLAGLRMDKPHLFRVESMADILAATRRVAGLRTDRVYMRLEINRGGVAIDKTELPELPLFRRQIVDEARLHAVQAYAEPLVVEHPVSFVAGGEHRFPIQVSRRADQ